MKNVQRGSVAIGVDGGTFNVTISSVNLSKANIIVSANSYAGDGAYARIITAHLTSATNLQFIAGGTVTWTDTIYWEVAENY